jgi:hypothetical protein
MPKRSRIAKDTLEQLERARLQIIPRGGDEAHIRGDLGPRQLDLLQAVLPELKAHWPEVLAILGNRDENEAATAAIRIITGEGESPAALLGRRGGLKGGKARAAAMTKKERSESAKKAARARWSARRAP